MCLSQIKAWAYIREFTVYMTKHQQLGELLYKLQNTSAPPPWTVPWIMCICYVAIASIEHIMSSTADNASLFAWCYLTKRVSPVYNVTFYHMDVLQWWILCFGQRVWRLQANAACLSASSHRSQGEICKSCTLPYTLFIGFLRCTTCLPWCLHINASAVNVWFIP